MISYLNREKKYSMCGLNTIQMRSYLKKKIKRQERTCAGNEAQVLFLEIRWFHSTDCGIHWERCLYFYGIGVKNIFHPHNQPNWQHL